QAFLWEGSMKLRNLWLAALVGIAAVVVHSQSLDRNPRLALQGPDHYSFGVGNVKVTALSDGTVPQDLHVLLRNTTNQKTDALLDRSFLSNPVEASINAFLFRSVDRLVLVDTGAGEFFGPGFGGKLVSSLASIGVAPQQITDVLLTHAYDDHMGVFRFRWKWRRRSPSKVMERTHEEATEALHARREGRHSEAASA